jgi:signal transduction histidine kinase
MASRASNLTILRIAVAGILLLYMLSSCSRINNDNKEKLTDLRALIDKAAATSVSGNKLAPVHYLDSALAGKSLTITEEIEVNGFKSDIYNNQLHEPEMAMLLADSMLRLVENAGPEHYQTEYALANFNKGDILFNLKKYNEAYSYYYRARAIGKTSLDSCTLGEYSFRLALVLYRQSRFAEAATTFERSFKESHACNIDFGKYYRLQQVLNNIGLSFYKAHNTDSALYFYNKGLAFVEENRSKFPDRQNLHEIANAVIYGNMADIFRLQKNTAAAKQLLKQSIAINIKKGADNQDAQYSQIKLAEIYADEGYTDSMHTILSELRHGFDTIRNPRAEMDWNRLMWKYYNSRNDSKNAYPYLASFTTLRDSLEKEANQLKTADLSEQIKTMENQYEIQSLQKDNELKKVYLWIAVVSSVLAVIIVFFIFRNLIRSRKNVALLQSLNEQVNEQKHQLQDALSSLEEKNKQQERILRAVAHDLRGPVATIAMLSDLILHEEDAASRAEMVEFVKTSCNNSLELITEILEAADQSKRKEQEKESVSVNVLIRNTADLLQLRASEKNQIIKTELPKQDLFLMVNPEKIKRVIANLITNAIKFSDRGATIKIKLAKDPEGAVLVVEDKGIGIPADIHDKIFDMFTEAKRKGTAGELPYGLGLSICKQIVEAHNGNIWFESKQGEGTSFYVKLPV